METTTVKIPKLKGSINYDIWVLRIHSLLVEKGLQDIFNDNLKAENEAYYPLSQKALATIRLNLEDSPLIQTQFINDARMLWSQLETLYRPKGFNSEFLICRELFTTTLAKCGHNIEAYLTKVRRCVEQLNQKGIGIPTKVTAAYVLSNLSPEYESTVAIISQTYRSSDNNIDLLQLFSQLIDESQRLKTKHTDTEMAMPIGRPIDKPKPKCKHCHKKGHQEDKCWVKYPNLKEKKNSSTQKRGQPLSHPPRDSDTTGDELTLITTIPDNLDNQVLNLDHYDPEITWYLDSGATRHICADKTLFTSLKPCETTLNWGKISKTQATGIGTVRLKFASTGQIATISDCLYLP